MNRRRYNCVDGILRGDNALDCPDCFTTYPNGLITYGVCVDGALLEPSHETDNPTHALTLARALKAENPDDVVTIVLWT